MRAAIGCFVSALVLLGSGAAGLAGSWALRVGAVALLFSAVIAAVVMEDRTAFTVEGLVSPFAGPSTITVQAAPPSTDAARRPSDVA